MTVIRLDGSIPVKYGLRLNMDEKYSSVKSALSNLCGVPAHLLRLAEVTAAQIKVCICLAVGVHAAMIVLNYQSFAKMNREQKSVL
jgi:hypothetical protein